MLVLHFNETFLFLKNVVGIYKVLFAGIPSKLQKAPATFSSKVGQSVCSSGGGTQGKTKSKH